MNKEILETIKEILEDMSYYPSEGDSFYNSFSRCVDQKLQAYCKHKWTDARNEVIQSGEVCFKCGAVRSTV